MAQYEAFDPRVEVHGRTILTVVDDALTRFSEEYQQIARDALAENGVVDPAADEWYPQQAWLNAIRAVAEDLEPHLLDRIGEQIPEVTDWPTGLSSIEEGLESIDDAYRQNHRGGEIGFYRFERIDEQSGTVTCKNPYPCLFDRGMIRAVAQRQAPVKAFVFIEERGDACRREGAEACTYTVSW